MRLIIFEGADNSGKTTQARLLSDRLGGLPIRSFPDRSDPHIEISQALLTDDALFEHFSKKCLDQMRRFVEENIDSDETFIVDRFWPSNVAYAQSRLGRACDIETVHWLQSCVPQRIVFLDADPLPACSTREQDALDCDAALQERVMASYRGMASDDWVRIKNPTGRAREAVHDEIVKKLLRHDKPDERNAAQHLGATPVVLFAHHQCELSRGAHH